MLLLLPANRDHSAESSVLGVVAHLAGLGDYTVPENGGRSNRQAVFTPCLYYAQRRLMEMEGHPCLEDMSHALQTLAAFRQVITHSFLGVGAPEAILVGVVALVVFGPKGLAEAAKSVGQTLRAFQPTIREVVEVSQELKGTLERELGLDELRDASRPVPRTPRPASPDFSDSSLPSASSSSSLGPSPSDLSSPLSSSVDGTSTPSPSATSNASWDDSDMEAKRVASAQLAWGNTTTPVSTNTASSSPAPPSRQAVSEMSMADLEAELAKRKANAAATVSASAQEQER